MSKTATVTNINRKKINSEYLPLMEERQYTADFFEAQMPISKRSAKVILPIIFDLIQPKSILDVGCGTGVWLNIASSLGVNDFIGIDGEYVKKDMLEIPEVSFKTLDLKNSFSLGRKFDLVISAEVAEHLPENVSDHFVASLINHSDYVLFSAAAPGQGGTYHINEQPQQYWVEKFSNHGFLPIDLLRSKIWTKKDVDWWYKQNMILFARKELVEGNKKLSNVYERNRKENYNLIHPEMTFHQKNINNSFDRFIESPVYSIRKFLSYTFS